MVGALLKPLSALSVASATSNYLGASLPDRAVDARQDFAKCVQRSSKRRARGGAEHQQTGRESHHVLRRLRRPTLFGIGFKLVRTSQPLPNARADARRPAGLRAHRRGLRLPRGAPAAGQRESLWEPRVEA